MPEGQLMARGRLRLSTDQLRRCAPLFANAWLFTYPEVAIGCVSCPRLGGQNPMVDSDLMQCVP